MVVAAHEDSGLLQVESRVVAAHEDSEFSGSSCEVDVKVGQVVVIAAGVPGAVLPSSAPQPRQPSSPALVACVACEGFAPGGKRAVTCFIPLSFVAWL